MLQGDAACCTPELRATAASSAGKVYYLDIWASAKGDGTARCYLEAASEWSTEQQLDPEGCG